MKVSGMLFKKYLKFFEGNEKIKLYLNDDVTIRVNNIMFYIPIEVHDFEENAYEVSITEELKELVNSIKSKKTLIDIITNGDNINFVVENSKGKQECKVKAEIINNVNTHITKKALEVSPSIFLPFIQIANYAKENEFLKDMGKIRLLSNKNGMQLDCMDLFENVLINLIKPLNLECFETNIKIQRQFPAKNLTKPLLEIMKIDSLNNIKIIFNETAISFFNDSFRIDLRYDEEVSKFILKEDKGEFKKFDGNFEEVDQKTSDQISYKNRKMSMVLEPVLYREDERYVVFKRKEDDSTFQYIISKKRS